MQIGVHGIGMVTALGLDWRTSCAASRAGVSRAEQIDHFRVQADDPWEVQNVTAHRVTLLTYGFEFIGRFKRLLAGALADLVKQGLATLGDCPVYLCLPMRTHQPEDGDEEETYRTDWTNAELWGNVILAAATLAKWPGGLPLASVSFAGSAGFVHALRQYEDERSEASALIVAIDSLLDDAELLALHESSRLKNTANPIGLVPGEAAVALLVGKSTEAMAILGPVAFAQAESADDFCKPDSGDRLAQLIENVSGPSRPDELPWIICDHNGEASRGQIWGSAMHSLCARHSSFRDTVWSYPAASLGDTRGASTPVAIGIAVASWSRGYAHSRSCCIVTAGQDSERAALMMKVDN